MERICATPGCGAVIDPKLISSRTRKYCLTCRPSRNRSNPRVIQLEQPVVEVPKPPSGLVETYRRQLEAADRLDTPGGAQVMTLASMLAAGGHTASGAASLSRELRAAMEEAMRGSAVAEDGLDELAKRRERKASGA